jgi:sugar/nucleoside kinase (ribokinase family)
MFPKKAIIAGPVYLHLTPDLSSKLVVSFSTPLQPDQILDSEGVLFSVGGRAAVTGLALHRFGVPTHLVGKVGDDRFGEVVHHWIRGISPELAGGLVLDPSTSTGVTIHLSPPDGTKSTQSIPGANNTFYASDIPRADLQGADLFHFTDPAAMRSVYRNEGGELLSILQRARREGLTTSLDFALPDPSGPAGAVDGSVVLLNCLPVVDVFFADAADLVYLYQRDVYDRFAGWPNGNVSDEVTAELLHALSEQVLSSGVEVVLIKLGPRGLYLRTASPAAWKKAGRALAGFSEGWHGREFWAPAFKATGTKTGEGSERLVSGFLSGLLRGEEPGIAVLMASAMGAWTEAAAWEDLKIHLDSDWEALPLEVEGEGWRKEEPYGIWRKA